MCSYNATNVRISLRSPFSPRNTPRLCVNSFNMVQAYAASLPRESKRHEQLSNFSSSYQNIWLYFTVFFLPCRYQGARWGLLTDVIKAINQLAASEPINQSINKTTNQQKKHVKQKVTCTSVLNCDTNRRAAAPPSFGCSSTPNT